MILCFQVLATFGLSAVLSFLLSLVILLAVAAKSGLLRTRTMPKGRLLITPSAPPMPIPPAELMPLKAEPQY